MTDSIERLRKTIAKYPECGIGFSGESLRLYAADVAVALDRLDELTTENAKLRAALKVFDDIVSTCVIENDMPNRVKWRGEWIEGLPADCVQAILSACQTVARAALNTDALARDNVTGL